MKRRDFLKAIGIGCLGTCCNPLSVFAAGRPSLKSSAGYKASVPHLRLHGLRVSAAGVTSSDGMTWDPGPLLEQYDPKRPARRELYLHLFGENEIDDLLDEMHARYEALIPDIPFIGESNFHLQWFIPNSEKLAEYLVVANYGVPKKDFINLHLIIVKAIDNLSYRNLTRRQPFSYANNFGDRHGGIDNHPRNIFFAFFNPFYYFNFPSHRRAPA